LATSQNLAVVHLSEREPLEETGVKTELQPSNWRVLPAHSGLTNNGIHFTAQGYQIMARRIADGLDLPKSISSVIEMQGTNVSITKYAATSDSIRFVMTPARISSLELPTIRGESEVHASQVRLQFSNLGAGKYSVYVDDVKVLRTTSKQLKMGVLFPSSFQHSAVKRAYELTADKNMMFFHRHRPQNETYLFLFRKHEQGNNAVEVPQFDPIVDGLENRIQAIRNSTSYRVEVRRS
jgi:hypothetical protein